MSPDAVPPAGIAGYTDEPSRIVDAGRGAGEGDRGAGNAERASHATGS